MVSKAIRRLVGQFVTFIGWLTRPRPIPRSPQEQTELNLATRHLTLYDYSGCPHSIRTRKVIHRLNLNIESCDIRKCQIHRDNLLAEYGRLKAPCLRIKEKDQVNWIDEPGAIIDYLNRRFEPESARYELSP